MWLSLGADAASYVYPHTNNLAVSSLRETGKGWPACEPEAEQFSGLLEIDSDTNTKYFYWGFGPRSKRADAPVILWMTGGPGCSSGLALLEENGPCHVNLTTGDLYRNEWSWNNDAYVIYIDQPAGVGFSTADKAGYDHNEAGVSEDMYWFLQDLFAKHPQWYNNDFFVVGESYGGHYAPATAYRVFTGNRNGINPFLPLKGLAVGNGLTVPQIQYQYYEELAYDWCIKKLGHPCVSEAAAFGMKVAIPPCVEMIHGCQQTKDQTVCSLTGEICGKQWNPYQASGFNMYDIRKECLDGDLCYNFSVVDSFMNRDDVQEALGVAPRKWQDCNNNVNGAFNIDWFQDFGPNVRTLIEGGIRTLIYDGDADFVCNWIGNHAWALDLEWNHKGEFNAAQEHELEVEGKVIGLLRHAYNFSFLQVYDAGHMVPMDQPEASYKMLKEFVSRQGL